MAHLSLGASRVAASDLVVMAGSPVEEIADARSRRANASLDSGRERPVGAP